MATLLDTFTLRTTRDSTWYGTYTQSSIVLASGVEYEVRIDGNYNVYGPATFLGDPQPIMYTHSSDQLSTAIYDAEVQFAYRSTTPVSVPVHQTTVRWDVDRTGFAHMEPIGGPFSTWQPGHLYKYTVTGAGYTLRAAVTDSNITDNSGSFRIRVYHPGTATVGFIGAGDF